MYVIKRNSDGLYVAKKGHCLSYTSNFNYIRFFSTKEEAENEACGNERVVKVG